MAIHGGDIYRNQIRMDFSININPLGVPERARQAMLEALDSCCTYPDIEAQRLKEAVGKMLSVPEDALVFGNGASELFMATVHAMRPKKTVIPVPSFYGYEHAAGAGGGEVAYAEQFWTEDGFDREALPEGTELLFLANPNNPTGELIGREQMAELLCYCQDRGIVVVLDECFIEFCGEACSMLSDYERFPNLILVRAFTKIFSIPGVRLGYLAGSGRELLEKIKRQLPEWNLSCFAQAAGCACAKEQAFVAETVWFVEEERQFLKNGLEALGMEVFDSRANFLLFYSEKPLYEKLLEQGILIRDCKNYRGLSEGFYRIAVKSRKENEALLCAMGEIR